ncbi:beta-ketoacyl-ACP synthase III [Kitasatospora sp. NPDC056184]|uniref:beta-ketoacyl-ACP synthase III n=1 Tax=Kitasatospora sp. NPDC056184 TaxID=3345738 RepID=UPI0035E0C277
MPGSRIVALGHHQPAKVLTNHDLAGMVDTSDEWIRQRTGIVARRIAEDETVTDLAASAAAKALAAAGLDPGEIDLVVVATCTAMDRCPSIGTQVAGRLGIPAAVGFDVNNGCAGFCTALATADHAVRAGAARYALVVGAERMSDVTDWTDRSTCVLLGDGAGAAVLGPDTAGRPGAHRPGVGPVVWGSDPTRGHAVRLDDGWRPHFRQEGQTVYRWATTAMVPIAEEACRRAGLTPSDLGAVVTHQANLRIIEALADRLGATGAVVARDVVESGNTSAASVPLALAKLVERGEVFSGAPALLLGFGGGLSWAGQVVTCP